mmetsp:Transcript_41925/g.115614  ORF Transcript_41925/g.115614 Transcript_41925/m.115614 type:complete len:203 (-) Transcript_41925:839-1447(-)
MLNAERWLALRRSVVEVRYGLQHEAHRGYEYRRNDQDRYRLRQHTRLGVLQDEEHGAAAERDARHPSVGGCQAFGSSLWQFPRPAARLVQAIVHELEVSSEHADRKREKDDTDVEARDTNRLPQRRRGRKVAIADCRHCDAHPPQGVRDRPEGRRLVFCQLRVLADIDASGGIHGATAAGVRGKHLCESVRHGEPVPLHEEY